MAAEMVSWLGLHSPCIGCGVESRVSGVWHGAIGARHSHHGYMADFDLAYALVRRAIETGEEPLFGIWF